MKRRGNFSCRYLVGEQIETAAELMARIAVFKGNPFAKAAVETAWWALDSKLAGVPLWQSLGAIDPTVACGADFGVQDTIDELLSLIQECCGCGISAYQIEGTTRMGYRDAQSRALGFSRSRDSRGLQLGI